MHLQPSKCYLPGNKSLSDSDTCSIHIEISIACGFGIRTAQFWIQVEIVLQLEETLILKDTVCI